MVSREQMEGRLKKQHYALIGQHSACKTCAWTKKSLKREGVCYKQQFYGIKSHRCVQLSVTNNYCNNSCLYCWRDRDNWQVQGVDDPREVIDKAIQAQRTLLAGFGGYKGLDKEKFLEAQDPKHFAISLTGETLFYPRLGQLIRELHSRGLSSFVVTNGTRPEVMASIQPTQLYLSLSAPNKEVYDKVCRPSMEDSWERVLKSLDVLKALGEKTRTALRLTAVKGVNMSCPEQYAELIERARPWFVEVKAYMWVGASREILEKENMPLHEEVKGFAESISKECSYKRVDEHKASRVVLLMDPGSGKEKVIDFDNIRRVEEGTG